MNSLLLSDPRLAASVTWGASKQTYYTVRMLVDGNLVDDAYRAYAYYRWVDDRLDSETLPRTQRLAFVSRQQKLMDEAYQGRLLSAMTPEEALLVDLIRRDDGVNRGLESYIRNMMAVMAFDTERRGRLITRAELNEYTRWLAVAVTEALHYFIGHQSAAPGDARRYQAAFGAHIAHMLRDTVDDLRLGYYNIPMEVLAANRMGPQDIASEGYRDWIEERVRQARACFRAGRSDLARVESLRCRIAGYAYIRRFEVVVDSIERERYQLRPEYPERKEARRAAEMMGWALWMALHRRSAAGSSLA